MLLVCGDFGLENFFEVSELSISKKTYIREFHSERNFTNSMVRNHLSNEGL